MIFLFVLLAASVIAFALPWGGRDARTSARVGMGLAMAFAGLAHLAQPDPFVQHLPTWVPAREPLIYATGVLEVALGAALLGPGRWRPFAGLALAAYLVAVFPANVYVALADVEVDGQPGGWYAWVRLPFQALFVWWALWSTRAAFPWRTAGPARRSPVALDAARTLGEAHHT